VIEGLDERELAQIAECAHEVSFKAGQTIFREGEAAHHFYLLLEGKVALQVYAPGKGPITIETVDQGDLLGWSWLFPPYRWHFDAIAVEPTQAIALNAMCLRGKCEEDHTLGYKLVKAFSRVIVERLQATRLRLLDVYAPH
jgi:CRP-like cAMP-binding protein